MPEGLVSGTIYSVEVHGDAPQADRGLLLLSARCIVQSVAQGGSHESASSHLIQQTATGRPRRRSQQTEGPARDSATLRAPWERNRRWDTRPIPRNKTIRRCTA